MLKWPGNLQLSEHTMITPEAIAQIGRQIMEALPDTAKQTRQELEKNIRAILQSGIGKLDLVSREEVDAQVAVLMRTREKLEQMEQSLARLEQDLKAKPAAKQKSTTRRRSSKSKN